MFDPATATKLKEFVYAAGNRATPEEAYRQFRGRDPDPEALLKRRGFVTGVRCVWSLEKHDVPPKNPVSLKPSSDRALIVHVRSPARLSS